MKITILFIAISFIVIGCNSQPVFDLPTSRLDLTEIVKWNNEFYFSEGVAGLYKLEGDSLVEYKTDSIIDIKTCSGQAYLLRAPNDSTLIIVHPNNTEDVINNKTDLKSKYFQIHVNEKCDILLEYGTAFFKIQDGKFIDYDMIYGFEINQSPNGSDKIGYFNDFIFLTKYPGYMSGGTFQYHLDSSSRPDFPVDMKIRDFTIHKNQLLIVKGFHETIGDEELMETNLISLEDKELINIKVDFPRGFDISRIFSNGEDIFILSEKQGFFKLIDGQPQLLISINLRESGIEPESFFVDKDKIYLTTWEHGLLIFEGQDDEYDLKHLR
ncbi:MAG: hypothetical protein AAFY41_08480 [Bacteroidota bacterium]